MIELVLKERCTACGDCVTVCPTHVFDLAAADGKPVISRQEDCQTCYMCELYCKADALYVDPDRDHPVAINPDEIAASGLLGQYRRDSGWDEWSDRPEYASQFWRMAEVMGRGREMTLSRKSRS